MVLSNLELVKEKSRKENSTAFVKSRRCTVRVNCQTLNDTKNFEMSASGVIIGAPNIFSHVLYFNLVAVRVLWRPWPEIEEVFLIPLPAYLHIWSSSNLQVERIVLVPNLNYGLQFPTHCYKDGEKSKQNHNNKLYGLQNYLNFGSNWLFLSSFSSSLRSRQESLVHLQFTKKEPLIIVFVAI